MITWGVQLFRFNLGSVILTQDHCVTVKDDPVYSQSTFAHVTLLPPDFCSFYADNSLPCEQLTHPRRKLLAVRDQLPSGLLSTFFAKYQDGRLLIPNLETGPIAFSYIVCLVGFTGKFVFPNIQGTPRLAKRSEIGGKRKCLTPRLHVSIHLSNLFAYNARSRQSPAVRIVSSCASSTIPI